MIKLIVVTAMLTASVHVSAWQPLPLPPKGEAPTPAEPSPAYEPHVADIDPHGRVVQACTNEARVIARDHHGDRPGRGTAVLNEAGGWVALVAGAAYAMPVVAVIGAGVVVLAGYQHDKTTDYHGTYDQAFNACRNAL